MLKQLYIEHLDLEIDMHSMGISRKETKLAIGPNKRQAVLVPYNGIIGGAFS